MPQGSYKDGELSCKTLQLSVESIGKYDAKTADIIGKNEDQVDDYEDLLGTYLVKLSSENLPVKESREIARQLHSISDFERISDHALNISASAAEMYEKEVSFSEHAWEEFHVISGAIAEIMDTTLASFKNNDFELASKVEPLEQLIDDLKSELKLRHITRLQEGVCTITQGFIFLDLLTNFGRIADHCSNIAVTTIQVNDGSFDAHEYLNEIKTKDSAAFFNDYEAYKAKYALPWVK